MGSPELNKEVWITKWGEQGGADNLEMGKVGVASQVNKQKNCTQLFFSTTTIDMKQGDGHDPVDPSFIVSSSQVSHPLRCIQGINYPETVGNLAG